MAKPIVELALHAGRAVVFTEDGSSYVVDIAKPESVEALFPLLDGRPLHQIFDDYVRAKGLVASGEQGLTLMLVLASLAERDWIEALPHLKYA